MILITGATGHLGTAVIEQLLKTESTDEIVVFARNESKAQKWKELGIEIRIGEFNDKDSLDLACKGIDKLLLITSNDENAYEQHKNVIDAAVHNNVNQLFYTSGALNHDIELSNIGPLKGSYISTENYIKKSGINYVICQNCLYYEVIPFFIGEEIYDNIISFPSGDGKASFASRREMGEAIANLIVRENKINSTVVLSSEASYSFQDIADILSDIRSERITFTSPHIDEYMDQLHQYGVSKEDAWFASLFAKIIINDEYDVNDSTLKQILGREPESIQEFLEKTYKKHK